MKSPSQARRGAISQPRPRVIGFDADDTLWHNERVFRMTQDRFAELLAEHAGRDHLDERLLAAKPRNLGHYGFGIKGFVLSMIETAIEVTDEKVPVRLIRDLLSMGQEMLSHPIDLLPQARETVEALAGEATLVLITKGDLLDRERKLAQSGLGELFDAVEIVSDKRQDTYARIFAAHGGEGASPRAAMVGNSLRSDVIPAIAAGGWGIHVPHDLTWEVEQADAPEDHPKFRRIADLGALPGLIATLD